MLASNLDEAVKAAICAREGVDPARQTRQYIAKKVVDLVVQLDGTQVAGFKLNRCQDPKYLGSSADWGYRLTQTA